MTTIALLQNPSLFSELSKRFNEGGPFFMSLILICLLLALTFLFFGFFNLRKHPEKSRKMMGLASDVSILGLVFGLLGSIFGLIEAFDAISAMKDIGSARIADGLKVTLLTTLFGSFTFILPRIGIIVLKGLHN
ncbi:MotA/TolQ/ExbB proton channel family protein [Snuella sedimenti]|uniref:MotA/TolQ/ExbB proton channel family protein n=1 Tax=Snuella sedimenti TaxID=2798802 RepID=A0A8J7IUP1_9FLAO|nr:MotA/TolQ/ExbB proton channel family protein [Snuella sedimenti]MBJ6367030.1 MotA/TolQ/ExbB proton channel family protein [Snuella sedimenti]